MAKACNAGIALLHFDRTAALLKSFLRDDMDQYFLDVVAKNFESHY